MDGINDETIGLQSPSFTDKLVGREAFECLEPSHEIIGIDEVGEMLFELLVIVVVETLDGRVFDRSVHSLDLPIGPWVLHFGQAMLNTVLVTDPVEDVMESVEIAGPIGELNAITPSEACAD